MVVYITKYLFSKGIKELWVTRLSDKVVKGKGYGGRYYFKPDWHSNKQEALKEARRKKRVRLKYLSKRLKKIEDIYLEFQKVKALKIGGIKK